MSKVSEIIGKYEEILESNSTNSLPQTISSSSEVTHHNAKGQGSANVRVSSNNRKLEESSSVQKIARVSYSKRIRRITLERYLVSKIAHHPEKCTFEDLLVVYDNLLSLQDLSLRDPGFKKKFGSTLEVLANILKNHRFSTTNFLKNIRILSGKLKVLEGFILPERNIQGTERHIKGLFHILPYKEQGIPTKQLPPKAYIGVGYSDKGHYTDPAYDGSPHWTEVIRGGVE